MDDYSAFILCYCCIFMPTLIATWYCGGPAEFFDTIVGGFKTIFEGLI